MDRPLVSIVIPCYNAERYVGEAIESALGHILPRADAFCTLRGKLRFESGPTRRRSVARNRDIDCAMIE
jgi:hypothetical protein